MADPAGEADGGALRLDFDRRVMLQFHGSAITSDGGLLAYRELDDVLALTTSGGERLAEVRTGRNRRHLLVGLLRQSVFGRLAGYEDVNDADRLCRDPAMRWVVGGKAPMDRAASASQMGRFEAEWLAGPKNLAALADLPGQWIDAVHKRRQPRVVVLDMDSSESPTYGDQEGSAYNGHFGCTLSTRNIDSFKEPRGQFTTDQWLDLLMRSLGYEPNNPIFSRRGKLHYLLRLVPFIERNYNLIELGPRGTGKSFVYQQLSPYCHLVSGGQTTTAQMFVNLSTGQRGLVALWDVVAFDEAAGVRFTDRNGINILKGYMEDGLFSRGRDVITAEGSIVFVGNIDGDIDTILRTSNLFYPMPREMDTAFYDRIHAYVPGWEFQKTSDAAYTYHFGIVTDYLAEVFRELRKQSYNDYAERHFRFGTHLGGRDQKAVRKTVSGLVKLLHPDGEVAKAELEEYLSYAFEMRRRVKEQLKRMGGLEYWDTSFSYIDKETAQETFVPVPEMGAGTLITEATLPPGSIYTIGTDADRRLALFLLQTQMNRGSGRVIPLGSLSAKMREAIRTADAYLKANLKNLGIDHDLKAYDFSIQAINLNQAKEGGETSVAFFISLVSSVLGKPVQDRTVVLGDMSVQGMLLKVTSLPERMQLAVEAGARRILIPSENKRDLADVPDAILTAIQWQFYDSPTRASILAMGLD